MIISSRYNGPDGSGNGGWTAGSVAALLGRGPGEASMVTLRVPPPLETPLSEVREGAMVTVYAPDGTRVADGTAATIDTGPVPPVSFGEAVAVSRSYAGFTAHPFPGCFVCGPAREPGDGMRLFPGRVTEGLTATPWIVPADVSEPMVWAALDCPGGWTVGLEARPYVLGRITVRTEAVPEPGDACVVMGRLDDAAGRKAAVTTTLYGPAGTPLAQSTAIWIAIPQP